MQDSKSISPGLSNHSFAALPWRRQLWDALSQDSVPALPGDAFRAHALCICLQSCLTAFHNGATEDTRSRSTAGEGIHILNRFLSGSRCSAEVYMVEEQKTILRRLSKVSQQDQLKSGWTRGFTFFRFVICFNPSCGWRPVICECVLGTTHTRPAVVNS